MDYIEAATRVTEAFLARVNVNDFLGDDLPASDAEKVGARLGELYASAHMSILSGINKVPSGGNGKPPRQTQVNRY